MRPSILLAIAVIAAAQTPPAYEGYAIRYATIPEFALSGLVAGADPARKMDIAMLVWLLRGGGKNILVDSGFGSLRGRQRVADHARLDQSDVHGTRALEHVPGVRS